MEECLPSVPWVSPPALHEPGVAAPVTPVGGSQVPHPGLLIEFKVSGQRWETSRRSRRLTSPGVLYVVESKVWPPSVGSQSLGTLSIDGAWSLLAVSPVKSLKAQRHRQAQGFNSIGTSCPLSCPVCMRLWPVAGPALLVCLFLCHSS